MLLWLASAFFAGAAAHFEFRGYVKPPEATNRAYIINTLGGLIKDEKFYLQTIEVPEAQTKDKPAFFTAHLETDKDVHTISEKYKNSGNIFIVFWRPIAEINRIVEIAQIDLPDCKNGGTRLPNGSCACGPFTYGATCETAKCQRKGIVEGVQQDRCYCPPGWYAEYCEIRGCRPPIEDNLSVDTRSFLLVLPVSSTNDEVKNTLVQNIQASLNDLNAKENGWIGTYLLNLIAKNADGTFVHYTTVSDSIDGFVANLRNTVVISPQPSDNWPIMDGLVHIQQFTRKMNPNSIIVVFSDAGDTNAGPTSYIIGDNTFELQATQTTVIWRSRIYFFMLQTPEAPFNTTGDQYDTFRRVATFTHGDLFVINKNEMTTILSMVIPLLYRPEYVDVRSFANCSEIMLDTHRDDPTQIVTVFVTLDVTAGTPQNWTITASDTLMGKTYLDMLSVGPYWAVFQVPPGWNSVRIHMTPSSICSAKAFINSKSTLLWAYSDADLTDVGNFQNHPADTPMKITLNPVNFPLLENFYVEFANSATSNVFTWPMYAEVRGEKDCTFQYKVPALPKCAAGAYTQKFTFTTSDNRVLKRIHPGFCSLGSIKNNSSAVDPPIYPIQGPGNDNNCYLINPADMGGKLHDFRQIIFAVEISTEMGDVVNQLKTIIGNVVASVQTDNVKRQYSLIVFDVEGWKALVSDYDPTYFTAKFKKFIYIRQDRALPPGNAAFSLDAIYQATQIQIKSPAQIHVFTKSKPKGSNHYWVLPTDVQVNWFYMTENGEVPIFSDMNMMQKQTGGRMVSLAVRDLTPDFFISSVFVNNLIIDSGMQKCENGAEFVFQVEKAATSVEITVLGANVQNVQVNDASGKSVDKIRSSVNSKASQIFILDPAGTTPGTWKLTLKATGNCYAQVRAISPVNVGVGFTSDIHSDFPAKHPFVKRGTNPAEFVVVRATGSKQVTSVTVLPADFNQPWVNSDAMAITAQTITLYNENTCAYQYRTDEIQMPLANGLKVRVTGQDESGSIWIREFNYYTPDDDSSECNGGKSNTFGECACPENHTGEYCWDQVCAYGSTPSKGICMCNSYYYGDRCENIRLQNSNATEPPAPPATTTPFTATTTTVTPTTTTFSNTAVVSWITVLLSTWMF